MEDIFTSEFCKIFITASCSVTPTIPISNRIFEIEANEMFYNTLLHLSKNTKSMTVLTEKENSFIGFLPGIGWIECIKNKSAIFKISFKEPPLIDKESSEEELNELLK